MNVMYNKSLHDHSVNIVIRRMGFRGDPARLRAVIRAVQEECCDGLPSTAIVCDPSVAAKLCKEVRRRLGEPVSDQVILRLLLLWMRRTCRYCRDEYEGDEYCDECDGCPECCQSEEHCWACRNSLVSCSCQEPLFEDGEELQ